MNIWKVLELKFTSGNSVAVPQVTLTRAEYDELLAIKAQFKWASEKAIDYYNLNELHISEFPELEAKMKLKTNDPRAVKVFKELKEDKPKVSAMDYILNDSIRGLK